MRTQTFRPWGALLLCALGPAFTAAQSLSRQVASPQSAAQSLSPQTGQDGTAFRRLLEESRRQSPTASAEGPAAAGPTGIAQPPALDTASPLGARSPLGTSPSLGASPPGGAGLNNGFDAAVEHPTLACSRLNCRYRTETANSAISRSR